MNMMNKFRALTILIIATVFPVPGVAVSDATTVTIKGNIINNTCTLDTKDSIWTLGDISIREFGGKANVELGSVIVPITFVNCGPDLDEIKVKISGTLDPDASSNTVFKNTGSAKGVGIRFLDVNMNPFKPDGTTTAAINDFTFNKGDATITAKYTAKYISTGENITAGSVSTVINAVFTYN